MQFRFSRLRSGELIAAAGALALLIAMFALPWYGAKGSAGRAAGYASSITGYDEFMHLRWLILLTIAVVFALVFLQATRSPPALPASFSVISLVLCLLTTLWLIYRVLINVPSGGGLVDQKYGAYIGLASSLVMTYGAFRSLRQETKADPQRNARIPVAELDVDPGTPPPPADVTRDG